MADEDSYNDEYGTCDKTYATLRIASSDEHPSTVGARLGLEPTCMRVRGQAGGWRRGEWRLPSSGGPVARSNHWSLSTEGVVMSQDSRRHVDHLLSLLGGKDADLVELRDAGWKAEVIVFWDSKGGHGGPSLSPPTMRRLSELELSIWYDVYFSEPDRPNEKVEGHPGVFRVGF